MEMTIMQAQQRLHEKWMELTKEGTDEEMMQALSIANNILGSYDESLKSDLKAILVELQLDIEGLDFRAGYDGNGMPTFSTDYIRKKKVNELIQQKIDKLKSEEMWDAEYKEPTTENLCDACGNSINCMMQSGIVRTECAMYKHSRIDLGVDCISRADAQTEIEINTSRYTIAKERGGMGQVEWSDQLIKVSDAVDIIRHLPSVVPQEPRWISCSERLPEENVDVLVVVEFPNGKDGTLQRIEISSFGLIYPLSSEKGWITNNFTRIARTEVIAWMPLPKPYEPQESEVEDGNDD